MLRFTRATRRLAAAAFLVGCCAAHAFAQVVFEPPVPLAASAPTDEVNRSDKSPAAATNGTGTWVVAWSGSLDQGTTSGSDDDILFARSTDGGLTFTAQAALNTDHATDSSSFVLPGGAVIRNSRQDGWPAVAAHGNRFFAVWERTTVLDDSVMFARSEDGGATWSAPTTLVDDARVPTIASDGAGTWIIAWQGSGSPGFEVDVFFTRSTDDGATWSPVTALDSNAGSDADRDRSPRLAFAGGVWVAAWTMMRAGTDEDTELLYARSTDGGATWSAPAALNTNAASETDADGSVRIAGDGTGHWVAVWGVSPPNRESEILTARSSDGALTWSAPTPLNTDFATDDKVDGMPDVVAGGPGAYVATWIRDGLPDSPASNRAKAVTASSSDGGATWSAPVFLNPAFAANTTYAKMDLYPRVAHDPAGWYFAVWASNDPALASGTKGNDYDVVMALAGHPCGDGIVGAGETCDDGDRGTLDCCGRTCTFDPPDTACAADADLCTLERCDGAGTCLHPNAPLGTHCDADADLCTFDRCDGNAVCEHVYEPRTGCLVPTRPANSSLLIKDGGTPKSRKLTWSWKYGPETLSSTFSVYLAGADFALCVYDGNGLVARADVPEGGTCNASGADCWRQSGKGDPLYADPEGTPNGVRKVSFKSGPAGKTSVKLTAKGEHMSAVTLPVASPPVHAVFINEYGLCFDATYSTKLKNDGQGCSGKSE